MKVRRLAGVAFGYVLLAVAVLVRANAVRIAALGVLPLVAVTDAVFFAMANLGAAVVAGVGGAVVLQRVRRIGAGYGVDFDWGRVLGP
ncbi:hypothetical protein [Halobaculum marinum]|uniref:Uncharacterized protein n=1 Tax=Halobaculum marinum TaxID=3031996 RepID=A0ABD5X4H3_9EURY|nr:hypothetical protein [Halobaculum sp. DT55]